MLERADYLRESIDFLQRFIAKSMQKEAEGYGFTVPQIRVIAEVMTNKTSSIKQLTHNLKMTQSSVSDIVERLIGKGILEKTPNPKDKRSVVITLTKGAEDGINKKDYTHLNEMITGALSQLNAEEQEIVMKGMQLLVGAVKEKMTSEGMNYNESFDVMLFPTHENKQ
ncbi:MULTISPECIES: helix-turn-helix domain-containing protein [unclassified Niallia]|uniref:MarR family winged helix-turn-helix transcriptional regulator n=1 Tax=Niallia TaxID=2837506 RepID=UPI001EDA861D|nr:MULTISPECIES: helix-turn-helix domain-containing protein [unclassified Niallia]MCM3032420.1 MarR family transcriptional regulator [Niallia sp. MER 6]UPO90184.1 MarR family transcriptional regulator [Niallia sp. Man26]